MRQTSANPILRYGFTAAIVNAALLGVDQAVRALGPAIIQSPQGHRALTISFFASVALVTLVVGYLTARDTGRVKAAMWAGALAVGLPAGVAGITGDLRTTDPNSTTFVGQSIAIVFIFTFAGALAGYLVAAIGALVGRAHYRRAHAEEIAALAAQRAAQRAADRARPPKKKMSAQDRAFYSLMFVGIFAVILAPIAIANVASNALTTWEGLLAAVGALTIGFGALRLGKRADWRGYLYDFVGLILIVSGLIVGVAEITGYEIPLLTGIGEYIYLMRAVDRDLNNRLNIPKPSATEPPEQAPVFFRNDGETIDFYPSRLKLVGHAFFAGAIGSGCGALAVVFRSADPMIVFALSSIAVLGFLFGFIPDIARLLYRRPTLTVNSEGIIDRGSGLITGFGLIPWHEIKGVIGGMRFSRYAFTELNILPAGFERLIRRQPFLKRPLLRLGSAMHGGWIAVSSLYLAQAPREVAARINEYVESHAPASYLESEDDEDDEDDEGDEDVRQPPEAR